MSSTEYSMEEYVNRRMGYTIKDLWNLQFYGVVYAGRTRPELEHIKHMHKAPKKDQMVYRAKALQTEKKHLQEEEKRLERKMSRALVLSHAP